MWCGVLGQADLADQFSAAGVLGGELPYSRLGPSSLTGIRGGPLILTAFAQLSAWSRRWYTRGALVSAFGPLSRFFGGVAGNQGGLRAAALTTFRLSPDGFVATATATHLLVDLARTPIYLRSTGPDLLRLALPIGIAAMGVLIGTLAGERFLLGPSPRRFGHIVEVAIGLLGDGYLVSRHDPLGRHPIAGPSRRP